MSVDNCSALRTARSDDALRPDIVVVGLGADDGRAVRIFPH